MIQGKFSICLSILAGLLVLAGLSQAAPIPGTAGTVTLQDGPNVGGDSFEINVHYEAFDGLDASDPLGVTPGKKQFAYILEYVSGNKKMGIFDIESINAVPIIETGTSTNGTVNGVSAGAEAPLVNLVLTLPSGNPASRFVYKEAGLSSFGLEGAKSVILVFTADQKYDIQTSLAQIVDASLSAAGEVVGPTECFGIVEGYVFCLDCGTNGEILPMDGITIKMLADSNDANEVASAATGENGWYQVSGLDTGQYTVVVDEANSYSIRSLGSVDIEVACDAAAFASFCVCPPPCQQQICINVVHDQNGVEVPVRAWVGIRGPEICRWCNTGGDGAKCFKGKKIVPGHYEIKIKPRRGYEVAGDSTIEFDLAECESKELMFYANPIPPCGQSACISVVEAGDGNDLIPVEGVIVKLKQCRYIESGTTGSDGQACFSNLKAGHYVASINVPEDYRMCDNGNIIPFHLKRCEHKDIEFTLCKRQYGPCPGKPRYWKYHSDNWPITSMWIGADVLEQPELMNILNGKLADGSNASPRNITVELAQNLIAVKLSIAAGSDPADIESVVVAADEFLLYDYPPGSRPRGEGRELARKLKNQLQEYLKCRDYCEPLQ